MATLFLPPEVSRELLEERARREGAANEGLRTEDKLAWVADFNRHLKAIEPYLKLVFCPDQSCELKFQLDYFAD